MMDMVRIATLAAEECVRQQVGLSRVGYLLTGYRVAKFEGIGSVSQLCKIAKIIEPSNKGKFRTVPVTFQNGGVSAPPNEIRQQVERLWENIESVGYYGPDTALFVKTFEQIHPFIDGNGRIGWVLYNFLRGTMDYPTPLPDFNF